MSVLNDTQTKLELIKKERLKTQLNIKRLKAELLRLNTEESDRNSTKNDMEIFMDQVGEKKVKLFILSLFNTNEYANSQEYSKVLTDIDAHELLQASISNDKKYFGAFVITYCLLNLNMHCKDISKKFNKSRSWATYKAIEILTIRIKKYVDHHYNSHIIHYKELYNISEYSSHSDVIKLSS